MGDKVRMLEERIEEFDSRLKAIEETCGNVVKEMCKWMMSRK